MAAKKKKTAKKRTTTLRVGFSAKHRAKLQAKLVSEMQAVVREHYEFMRWMRADLQSIRQALYVPAGKTEVAIIDELAAIREMLAILGDQVLFTIDGERQDVVGARERLNHLGRIEHKRRKGVVDGIGRDAESIEDASAGRVGSD